MLAFVVVCDLLRCSTYLHDFCEGAHRGMLAGFEYICAGLGSTRLDGDKLLRWGRCFSWSTEVVQRFK
jgi:hypothetical protein